MSGRTPVRRCPGGLPACLASRAARRELAPPRVRGAILPHARHRLRRGDASDATNRAREPATCAGSYL